MSELMDSGEKINKGQVKSRERRLVFVIFLLLILISLLVVGLVISFTIASFKTPQAIVVDSNTNEIIGSYSTTASRTDEEIMGATSKFIENELSWDHKHVGQHYATALGMMQKNSLPYRERIAYLSEKNLVSVVKASGMDSELMTINTVIKERTADLVIVQTEGTMKLMFSDGSSPRAVPFSQTITWKQIPISSGNTAGAEIVARKEYRLENAYDLIEKSEDDQ